MEKISYSHARQNLSSILNKINNNSEVFCIERKNEKKVVMVDKGDYESLLETAYLLQSPANAKELFKAIRESDKNLGIKIDF